MQEGKQFKIRLTEDLKQWLSEKAKREHRSITSLILQAVEEMRGRHEHK